MSKQDSGWAHDYAVIRLYREFEALMLKAVAGAINNDPSTISATTGVLFPKHLSQAVSSYLVTGSGYFDFKGRSGLIQVLRRYVPKDHYLIEVVSEDKYRRALDRLVALRNFAAHDSAKSKQAALEATEMEKIKSSGNWLRVSGRLENMAARLKELAMDIHDRSPY